MKNSVCRSKILGALLAGLIVSSNATAGDVFGILDKNADGVLSGSEAKMFLSFDTEPVGQPDGEVTKKEFFAGVRLHERKRVDQDVEIFLARNGNNDDRLSGTEISGYEFADLDGNGRITVDELSDGMAKQRAKLGTLALDELIAEGNRRFRLLDINEDNRLSGSEAVGLLLFDVNGDQRISSDEFMSSVFLDAASVGETPLTPAPQTTGEPMQAVVHAVNRRDWEAILGMFRPELKELVDAAVLDYLLHHITESHGILSAPARDAIAIKDSGKEGQKRHSAKPVCEKGTLAIEMTMFEGAILGIVFNSLQIDQMNEKMFADLFADKDNALKKFADFYKKNCSEMIRLIRNEEDSKAFGMFHPEIQKQIGLEQFVKVFKGLREVCSGTGLVEIELEEAGVEFDEKGNGKFFTIAHRVAGPNGAILFKHKMQFVGLKAHFVAASIQPVDAVEPVDAVDAPQATKSSLSSVLLKLMSPTKPPQAPEAVASQAFPVIPKSTKNGPAGPPTPATDDDDPVRPPASKKSKR